MVNPAEQSRGVNALFIGLLLLCISGNAYTGPAPAPTGTVKLLLGTVTVTPPGGIAGSLSRGDTLYPGYLIETADRSFVRVEMAEGTRFTVGKNAAAVIDEFSFSPTNTGGTFQATVVKGGFSYASGSIGQQGGARQHSFISTPTAVIGIRGSIVNGDVDAITGGTVVIHVEGILEVTNATGGNGVTLDQPGNTAEVDDTGETEFSAESTPDQVARVDSALPTKEEVEAAEAAAGDGQAADASDKKADKKADKLPAVKNNLDSTFTSEPITVSPSGEAPL